MQSLRDSGKEFRLYLNDSLYNGLGRGSNRIQLMSLRDSLWLQCWGLEVGACSGGSVKK